MNETPIFTHPITDIIRRRFSCRTYLDQPIEESKRQRLQEAMASFQAGPLGAPLRFQLLAATEEDRSSLRGLGTYGLIKGPTGFLAGAVRPAPKDLEDYGYRLEQLILLATDLELGTCWLGGFFTRSSFARKLSLARAEQMPAVATIGYIADPQQAHKDFFSWTARSSSRLPWEGLFFRGSFGAALSHEEAGDYATPLEMVRLAPSASNKQPWRVIREGDAWHFYLRRNRGYGGGLAGRLLVGVADLQRVDMGIALCHWQLTARELDLGGGWAVREPTIALPDALTEYTVSWLG